MVLSWLMREQRLAYDEALSRVREVRFVEPNLGFEQQLRATWGRSAGWAVGTNFFLGGSATLASQGPSGKPQGREGGKH